MPLSADPAARERQLANLRRGGAPAPVGNGRARTHGAFAAISERELAGKEAEVFRALAADAPIRDGDGSLPAGDALTVRLLAEALVRIERCSEFVLRRGFEDEQGKLRTAVEHELRLRGHALELARELGLTPRSRMALGLDIARAAATADQALDRLRQTGAQIIEQREAGDE